MDLLSYSIKHDWAILLPIIGCSVIVLGVAIERWWFYLANKVSVAFFVRKLQEELDRGIQFGQAFSKRQGGILGEVAEEACRIIAEHPERFEQMYDITTSLATRRLERSLAILGTIATISPYLGLFGTVVRILLTFGDLSRTGGGSGAPEIMFGIGSALIATAFGLGVAILAVATNNYFRTVVQRHLGDFDVLKLVFLGVLGIRSAKAQTLPATSR